MLAYSLLDADGVKLNTNNMHLQGGSSLMSVQRVLLAGVIASLVIGMLEMLYEAIAGVGFWSPVVFIAA